MAGPDQRDGLCQEDVAIGPIRKNSQRRGDLPLLIVMLFRCYLSAPVITDWRAAVPVLQGRARNLRRCGRAASLVPQEARHSMSFALLTAFRLDRYFPNAGPRLSRRSKDAARSFPMRPSRVQAVDHDLRICKDALNGRWWASCIELVGGEDVESMTKCKNADSNDRVKHLRAIMRKGESPRHHAQAEAADRAR